MRRTTAGERRRIDKLCTFEYEFRRADAFEFQVTARVEPASVPPDMGLNSDSGSTSDVSVSAHAGGSGAYRHQSCIVRAKLDEADVRAKIDAFQPTPRVHQDE